MCNRNGKVYYEKFEYLFHLKEGTNKSSLKVDTN